MVKHEFTFPSRDGRTAVHAVEWLPECPVRAILQISHGVSEYIDRYEPLAAYLAERGFAVVGNDHVGHGASIAEGIQPLYFGPKGSWFQITDDLYTLREKTGRQFPGVPYFLLGHSMGSFLVRTYLIRYPGTIDAAILMGTGQMSPVMVAAGRLIASREARKVGEDHPSPVVDRLAFGGYNKLFSPSRTAFDWLSVNEENVDRYVADPLCGGSASTGLFREMLDGIAYISKMEHLKKMNMTTPILFVSGSMDPVGDCGKGVQKACESFRRAGVRDVVMKLYPGLRHEILNETCADVVREDLYQWLASKRPELNGAAV